MARAYKTNQLGNAIVVPDDVYLSIRDETLHAVYVALAEIRDRDKAGGGDVSSLVSALTLFEKGGLFET